MHEKVEKRTHLFAFKTWSFLRISSTMRFSMKNGKTAKASWMFIVQKEIKRAYCFLFSTWTGVKINKRISKQTFSFMKLSLVSKRKLFFNYELQYIPHHFQEQSDKKCVKGGTCQKNLSTDRFRKGTHLKKRRVHVVKYSFVSESLFLVIAKKSFLPKCVTFWCCPQIMVKNKWFHSTKIKILLLFQGVCIFKILRIRMACSTCLNLHVPFQMYGPPKYS